MKAQEMFFSTEQVGDTTIMIMLDVNEGWEVYYRKPGYPFLFAFGFAQTYQSAADVMRLAINGINDYQDLFEEV